jgi:hypothetical protein
MHNLPLEGLLLACLFLVAFATRKAARSFLKDLFSVVEDRWTWTTQSGEIYEDAEIELIDRGDLVLKHALGISRLPITSLSDESHELLLRTPHWRRRTSPAPEKVASFEPAPMHAGHAA